jgi:transmembrane sensor
MGKEKYIKYITTEDFILDKEFCSWVLHPDKELNQFWYSFIEEYPEKKNQIREAAFIIKALQPIEQDVPQQRFDVILQKIKTPDKTLKLNSYTGLKYAAGIVLLIAFGCLIRLSISTQNQFPLDAANSPVLKGKIILANGLTREFDTEQTTIKQTSSGNIIINNDTIDNNSQKGTSAKNQIIIPYGKRSDVTLPDGTHIWLNSGSQLSYPTEFKPDSREVYLLGEAFFDVKPNPNRPFYVITRDIRIKVLGTSFNVSSYTDDNTIQTVLIRGKVSAGKNQLFAKTIDLIPGERMIYDKNENILSKDKVDVEFYASWVNGYLIFYNMPITEVYKKLERYYNHSIVAEEGLEKITFSGKLDLKDNIKDVLDNISFASSVNILENNESFIIKK